MASFKSILSDIGKGLEKFFSDAAPVLNEVLTIATDVEPLVAVALPGISGLYNATVSEVTKAEAMAIAAGKQNGTGAQKLAAVIAAITPNVLQYAQDNKLPIPNTAQITAYVNAIVASLNALPAN